MVPVAHRGRVEREFFAEGSPGGAGKAGGAAGRKSQKGSRRAGDAGPRLHPKTFRPGGGDRKAEERVLPERGESERAFSPESAPEHPRPVEILQCGRAPGKGGSLDRRAVPRPPSSPWLRAPPKTVSR